MRARVLVRAFLILICRALDWLRRGWRDFWSRPFFDRTPSVEFIDAWRWFVYPERKVVKLSSNTENPDFYYDIEEFRHFISQCRKSIESKTNASIKPIDENIESDGAIFISFDINHVNCEIRDNFLWIGVYAKRRMETSTFEWMLKTLEEMVNSGYEAPPRG